MTRLILISFFVFSVLISEGQPKQISLGIFTGFTSPYTWDEGVNNDSRYSGRFDIKFAPVGVCYGVDYQDFGLVCSPSFIRIGQNLRVINTAGGDEGIRKIDMRYIEIPVAAKLRLIDFSFFKLSFKGGTGIGFLLDGKEIITHNYAKYRFPQEVYPILPADYLVNNDGVIAPEVYELKMMQKKDFNSVQLFFSAGFRSDWGVAENWRVSLDVSVNYAARETRTPAYLQRAYTYQTLYDIAGKRREVFLYLNFGLSRVIEVDKEKEHKSKSQKKFTPKKIQRTPPNRGKTKF